MPALLVAFVVAALRGNVSAMAAIGLVALAGFVGYIVASWYRQLALFRASRGVWRWPGFAHVRALRYQPPILSRRERSALSWLFTSYFHQDWGDDFPDDDAVIRDFLAEASPEDVESTRMALDSLLARELIDEEMEWAINRELYCYYTPSELTITEWVRSVRARLG